jgi:hypothetical protein
MRAERLIWEPQGVFLKNLAFHKEMPKNGLSMKRFEVFSVRYLYFGLRRDGDMGI